MSPALQSLKRAIQYGLDNGKKNVIADLVPLAELFGLYDDLVNRCRDFQLQLKVQNALGSEFDGWGVWHKYGIADAINPPKETK